MSDNDTTRQEAPTRRDYMKYGGAIIGGGLLAGCAGQSDSGATPTETETDKSKNTETETSTPENKSYSVTMSPMGTVEFDAVPETAACNSNLWSEIAISLGQGDRITSVGGGYPTTSHYDQLPGVKFDTDSIVQFNRENKEQVRVYPEVSTAGTA